MDYRDQNILPEEFDSNRVAYLLDSAAMAEQGGNLRLAIHLYCAAFEASQDNENGVDERTLSGLRQAWLLACEQGDRSTAETIFNDLAPYNSDEQTRAALEELQEMATMQLGIKKEDMEDMATTLTNEMRSAGIDVDALVKRFENMQNNLPETNALNASVLPSDNSRQDNAALAGGLEAKKNPINPQSERIVEGVHTGLRYANLAGFERTKEKMRAYGIVDSGDVEMHSFLQQAESFHGISGPVLTRNFHFVGASREDLGIFAQATANEIGWPVVTMVVDSNEFGDGTIRVAAPVKRSFLGPPRFMDLPNPCTLVIQNIDILQELFLREEQAINKGQGPFGQRNNDEHIKPLGFDKSPGMPPGVNAHAYTRSLQHEVIGYLSALMARGEVFIITTSAPETAEYPFLLSEQLESLMGESVEIVVDMPDVDERKRVLSFFSENHPSFHDLDLTNLACLSDGMSRYQIIASSELAVEEAYSESLKNQRHQMVSVEDMLNQYTHYLDQDSATYQLVEDYLVALFSAGLESEMMQDGVLPNQISLHLDTSPHSDVASTEEGLDI